MNDGEIARLVLRHWGIEGSLQTLIPGTQSRVWFMETERGPYVVKLADDSFEHFDLGLRVSQVVDDEVIHTGVPVPTLSGARAGPVDGHQGAPRCLALLAFVAGHRIALEDADVADMGRHLGRIHSCLQGLDGPGAWTLPSGLEHSAAGVLPAHPAWVADFLGETRRLVGDWLTRRDARRDQLVRGDGPELLVEDGRWTGLVDWGATTVSSVAYDIGCWTVHLGLLHGDYAKTTAQFIEAYASVAPLAEDDAADVGLFQRVRLSSRASYQTDASVLEGIRRWILDWESQW